MHILGRRRFEVTGRFGLRVTPGGFGTPAFGEGPEVLRVAGTLLMHEVSDVVTALAISGSTLRRLADAVGVDLAAPFSVGDETPELGAVDEPLTLDAESTALLASWYSDSWQILDRVLGDLPPMARPATIQLWPEHFDAATEVDAGGGTRVTLGASPGDAFCDEPHLYVSPHGPQRPGDPSYWNAPFGALLRRAQLLGVRDPIGSGASFLWTGLQRLRQGHNA